MTSISDQPGSAELLSSVSQHIPLIRDGALVWTQTKCRIVLFLLWALVAVVLLLASLLLWGGYLLISEDPLSQRVDGAVVLQGSVVGELARVAGAVQVLKQGKTSRILLSVPRESYWGQPIAPIARAYIEKMYGPEVATHIEFCELDGVDSTEQEAEELARCMVARHWQTAAIVTSDYHTRRTGMVWRKMLRRQHSPLLIRIHGVSDPEFHADGWWRDRRSAKTCFLESAKVVWTLFGK